MAKPAFDQCGEEVGRRKEGRPALSQFSAQSKRKGFMRLRWFIGFAALAAAAQTSQKNPAADWPMYNRDLAGTRFSPLNQINTRNVSRLTRAWTYKVGKVKAEGITGGTELTPIVGNSMMDLAA